LPDLVVNRVSSGCSAGLPGNVSQIASSPRPSGEVGERDFPLAPLLGLSSVAPQYAGDFSQRELKA